MRMCLLFPRATTSLATQIFSPARLADELALRHDQFAAGVDVSRIAADFEAFKHGVVDAHVVGGGGDGMIGVRIPEDNVGIATGGEHAFFRIHAEDAGGGSGDEFYEALQRKIPQPNTVVMQQLKAVFDAGTAIGDFGEVVFAESFLIFKTKWAVVGGDNLEIVLAQAFP